LLVDLYRQLAAKTPSPIVELNRAVAESMASGPEAGLDLVDQIVETGALQRYHLLHSVRGDLLHKLERYDDAEAESEQAAARAESARGRDRRQGRAQASRQLAVHAS